MRRYLLLLVFTGMLGGCEMIEYHPYDVRLEDHGLNAANIKRIEETCAGKDTIRFVWMGDSQRWYDETKAFVDDVNKRDSIDFVMHGGDISDFGMNREFEWVHDIMQDLTVPYVALIGNHDILGNGLHVYEEMYGPLNFSFVAGTTKFVCLNTNALEFDYSYPVPDFQFIQQQAADTVFRDYKRTVVAMHANPDGDQFNNNAAQPFQDYITRMRKLMFCLHAHAHGLMVNDFFDDGIIYYGCAAMKDRSYMLFTVTGDTYSYEVVYY